MGTVDSSRERLVEAGLQAFARAGFDGASTREIARAAGVNPGLIPYHFGSKEGLWRAAVAQVFGELQARFESPLEMLQEVEPVARLRLLLRQFIRFSAVRPELHRLMLHEGSAPGPRLSWLVEEHVRPLFEAHRELLVSAQASGIFSGIAPHHLHYVILGAATHRFMVGEEFRLLAGSEGEGADPVDAYAEAVVRVLLGEGK